MTQKTNINSLEGKKNLSLWELIRSDIKRVGKVHDAVFRLSFYAVFFYRLAHFFSNKKLTLIASNIQVFSQFFTGAEISHKAKIGPSFYILHSVGVHIGPYITIGKNATICENSSIVFMDEESPPLIGDNLWLGPGGRIMGDVVIGNRVRVGPNSVVLKNVPDYTIALGVPAKNIPRKLFKK